MVTLTTAAGFAERTARNIAATLSQQERSWLWLSRVTGIARPTLRRKATTGAFNLLEVSLIAQALKVTPCALFADEFTAEGRS